MIKRIFGSNTKKTNFSKNMKPAGTQTRVSGNNSTDIQQLHAKELRTITPLNLKEVALDDKAIKGSKAAKKLLIDFKVGSSDNKAFVYGDNLVILSDGKTEHKQVFNDTFIWKFNPLRFFSKREKNFGTKLIKQQLEKEKRTADPEDKASEPLKHTIGTLKKGQRVAINIFTKNNKGDYNYNPDAIAQIDKNSRFSERGNSALDKAVKEALPDSYKRMKDGEGNFAEGNYSTDLYTVKPGSKFDSSSDTKGADEITQVVIEALQRTAGFKLLNLHYNPFGTQEHYDYAGCDIQATPFYFPIQHQNGDWYVQEVGHESRGEVSIVRPKDQMTNLDPETNALALICAMISNGKKLPKHRDFVRMIRDAEKLNKENLLLIR